MRKNLKFVSRIIKYGSNCTLFTERPYVFPINSFIIFSSTVQSGLFSVNATMFTQALPFVIRLQVLSCVTYWKLVHTHTMYSLFLNVSVFFHTGIWHSQSKILTLYISLPALHTEVTRFMMYVSWPGVYMICSCRFQK